jgi:hypothetical protein
MTSRAGFSSVVYIYFPVPFCGLCVDGPDAKDFAFRRLATSMDQVTQQTQLADPENVEDLATFVGKSLSTTRQEFLVNRFKEKRDKEKKKRLCRTPRIPPTLTQIIAANSPTPSAK